MNGSARGALAAKSAGKQQVQRCHICAKSFARRDVLRRHTRMQHGVSSLTKTSPRSRRKSCLRCALHKLKCSQETTCHECKKSGLLCQYSFEQSIQCPPAPDEEQPLSPSPKDIGLNMDFTSEQPHRPSLSMPSPEPHPAPTGGRTEPPTLGSLVPEPPPSSPWNMPGEAAFLNDISTVDFIYSPDKYLAAQTPISPQCHDRNEGLTCGPSQHPSVAGLDISALDTPKPNEQDFHFVSESSDLDRATSKPAGPTLDMNLHDPNHLTPRATPEDQLLDFPPDTLGDFVVVSGEHPPAMDDPLTTGQLIAAPKSRAGSGIPSENFAAADAEDPGQSAQPSHLRELRTPPGISRAQLRNDPINDTDPWEIGRDDPNQQTSRDTYPPRPRSVVSTDIFASIYMGEEVYSGPQDPTLEDENGAAFRIRRVLYRDSDKLSTEPPSSFPSLAQLLDFWNLYFTHFDKHCPILHRHLLKLHSCSPLIAAVVTTVGANYSATVQGRQYHQHGISQLCALLQDSTAYKDGHPSPDGSVLAAVCILLLQAIRSGKHDLSKILSTLVSANVSYLDRARLLTRKCPPGQFRDGGLDVRRLRRASHDYMTDLKRSNAPELQQRWLSWLKEETCSRLVWAHLTGSYLSSAFLRIRLPPTLENLDLPLPCEDAVWDAQNARFWANCFPWTFTPPPQLPFRATLRGLLSQTVAVNHVSRFGRLVYAALIQFELCRKSARDPWDAIRRSAPHQPINDEENEKMLRLAGALAVSCKS